MFLTQQSVCIERECATVAASKSRTDHVTLAYGYVKAKLVSEPTLKPKRHKSEIQYHLHVGLNVAGDRWDVAVNVGTNDADDLLNTSSYSISSTR
jgi:hypothetical protein